MKLTLLFACFVAIIAATLVQGDALQDEVNAALKKFCGGLAVTAPTKAQTFSNPKSVKVTVTRSPNSEKKVISGVDAYSIDSKGKAKYLSTIWKGSYTLNSKATLTVDLSKAKGAKFPGQFEFRVWVSNKSGPDCTLISKVFKTKSSSSHSNSVEEDAEFQSLSADIDRGCFGVELTEPALGAQVTAGQSFAVQINRDTAAHTDSITSLDLYRIDLDTRESVKIQTSWSGNETIDNMFNIKDTVPASAKAANSAFYYKLTSGTQHDEVCDFYSHPFYTN